MSKRSEDTMPYLGWSCSSCGETFVRQYGHFMRGERFCDECAGIVSVPENTKQPDTVTITISRRDAERFTEAYWDPDKECDCAGCQVVPVIRATLEGEK